MKRVFSPEAAEGYTLKNIEPGTYHFPGFGVIDLETITLEKADQLLAAKFPFLEEKKKKPQSVEPAKS